MKNATAFLLGLALVLGGWSGAQAQCSKRILLYLDTSGSMLRAQNGVIPYQATLEAVAALLREPGFFGDGDTLQVGFFGQTITSGGTASGVADVTRLLEQLNRPPRSSDTNFAAVFENIDQILAAPSAYDIQVVIIASDFVHDPTGTPLAAQPNLDDWNAVYRQAQEKLEGRFSQNTGKLPLVLFQAPASGWETQVQAKVLDDLTPGIVPSDQVFRVGFGGSSPEELVQGIKKALLFDLEVTTDLVPPTLDTIKVTVKNRNCIPMTLESIRLICPTVGGVPQGAPIPVDLAGKEKLGRRGDGETPDTQILEVSRDKVSCDESYEAVAQTREGAVGSTKGTNETWMRYQVEEVLLEGNLLLGGVMHILLGLQGRHVNDRSYPLVLSVPGQADVRTVATIFAPSSLDPGDVKDYRVTVPVSNRVKKALLRSDHVTVTIENTELLGSDTAPLASLKAEKEEAQSWQNLIQGFEAPLMLLLFGFAVLYKRRTITDAMGFAAASSEMVSTVWTLAKGALVLIGGILYLLRLPLVSNMPLSWANFLRGTGIFLAAFFGIALSLKALRDAQLVRDVYRRNLDDTAQYEKRVRSGWRRWVWGAIGATVLLLGVYFFLPDSEHGPVREIEAVEVVSD